MKCRECDACEKGWFESRPNDYVCIGVKHPFVIKDINAECTEYEYGKIPTSDCLVIGFDNSSTDSACLVVSKNDGKNITITNTFYGEDALKEYKKLVGMK